MAKKITTEEERIARKYAKMDERLQKEVKEIEEDLREKFGTVRLRDRRIVSPATWKEDYAKYGIPHVAETKDVPYGDGVIYVTSCTSHKSDLPRGTMEQMYLGKVNQKFYKYLAEEGLRYGTISGHLGMVTQGEVFDTYDLHTSFMIFEEILMDYGMKIAKQCREKGVNHVVYIQSSPCMSEPFIKRLWYAQQYYKEMYGEELGLTYVTKLTIVKNPEKHPELFV